MLQMPITKEVKRYITRFQSKLNTAMTMSQKLFNRDINLIE